jgi:hypothetical protein
MRHATAPIFFICLLQLGACVDDDLSNCISASEPIKMLTERTLDPRIRETLDFCRSHMGDWFDGEGKYYCDGLYLNANTPVQVCMKQRGYTFIPTCTFGQYHHAACYQSTWYLKLIQFFDKQTGSTK